MQNKYIINFAKKFWFWFWKKLMDGFAPADLQGNYKRPKGILVDQTNDLDCNIKNYYLLVGNSCPWCHRTLLVHKMKNLSKKVKVIFLKPDFNNGQWKKHTDFSRIHRQCAQWNDYHPWPRRL